MPIENSLQYETVVQKDHRVEVTSPELAEGTKVQVYLVPAPERPRQNILEFLESLPASTRTAEEWAEYDAELRRERDSWDD